ncbi:MAG: hypothetical protein PHV17_04565, partial [Candidatus Omnitrophica bacterium]|nr:hypothetical protein [Candidatus Omnitrophota bacterium]
KPKGKKNNHSGINITVSKADFDNFKKQIRDTIKFLKINKNEIKKLVKFPGLDEEPELDFGIERRNVAVQSELFPAELVALCGKLGLALALSRYPPSNDDDKEE